MVQLIAHRKRFHDFDNVEYVFSLRGFINPWFQIRSLYESLLLLGSSDFEFLLYNQKKNYNKKGKTMNGMNSNLYLK